MKKGILSVILILCMLCALLPVGLPTARAYSDTDIAYPVEGGNLYFDKSSGTITDCDETVTSADIPAEIIGVAVTSIGRCAFTGCSALTSVTIPNSVTSIGNEAFWGCTSLTTVRIPVSVTSIGSFAFYACSSLISVTLPDSLTSICTFTFYGCSSLTEITIPNGVTSIGGYAFYDCSSLTNMSIPKSVKTIEQSAFAGCLSLKYITILNEACVIEDTIKPAGMGIHAKKDTTTDANTLGYHCFTVIRGEKGSTAEAYAQKHDHGFSVIGSGIVTGKAGDTISWEYNEDSRALRFTGSGSIPDYGMYNSFLNAVGDDWENSAPWLALRDDILSVEIEEGIDGVGVCAFYDCHSAKTIRLPQSLTKIGAIAFAWCQALEDITIPNGITTIPQSAFMTCDSLKRFYLPSTISAIEQRAFLNCMALTEVFFAGDAPSIEETAFQVATFPEWENIPGLTLYYIEGKEGWTSPTWNGYPTATWDPDAVQYSDVPMKEWYYDAVQYAARNGLMGGTSANTFEPESAMTRAMLVTVLWRYEGKPMGYQNTFSDVNAKDGSWYIDAVAWAAANGIVGGVGNNKFDPDGNITREQMATILYRYAKKKGIDTGKRGDLSGFPDGSKVESWAKDALQWTVAEKIIGGSEGYLLPQGNATRAQVATILMRFIENIVKK